MKRILIAAALSMFLIWGTACTAPQTPTSQPPPVIPDLKPPIDPQGKAEIDALKKAKLEAARYEVQLYEEQLRAIKEEIRSLEQSAGTVRKNGAILRGPSDSLLAAKASLEDKVIQAKVKLRELELLSNAQK